MDTTREPRKSLEDAADAASAGAHRVAAKIGDGIDEAARTANRLGERLRENGAILQEELADASERFADGAKRIGDIASEQIRAHPLAAFGVAFLVGVVATRLMRR